ncbi:E3 ubiquitin-protein ligase RNF115 [Nymphon striatum]|nr:E3 ubiquitin-protein ligase RNF115 [Nymphon striatum]
MWLLLVDDSLWKEKKRDRGRQKKVWRDDLKEWTKSKNFGEDYVCPRCNSGFIEELNESEDNNRDFPEEDEVDLDHPINLEQLWGQLFNNLEGSPDSERSRHLRDQRRLRRIPGSTRLSGSVQESRDRAEPYHDSSGSRQSRLTPNRSPMPPFDTLPMEEIIQQVLANISSGGFSNSGLPILFNLHGNPGDYAWGRTGLDSIITQLLNQMDGSGPPPLSENVISQIPTVAISKEQVSKALQCTVCMEDFKVGESVRKLQCTHHFHHNCIVPWLELHGTCPICRQVLTNDPNEMEQDCTESTTASSSSSSNFSNNSDSSNLFCETNASGSNASSQSPSNNTTEQPFMPSVYDFDEEVD